MTCTSIIADTLNALAGPVTDNKGTLRIAARATTSDADLFQQD